MLSIYLFIFYFQLFLLFFYLFSIFCLGGVGVVVGVGVGTVVLRGLACIAGSRN